MKYTCLILLFLFFTSYLKAQDSVEVLSTVHINAFHYDRSYINTPAAVAVIKSGDLNRFDNTSLVPVFNSFPGITMEERSPGSYRLNIRGSSLRSPFGVRNVKIYYNNIPFTDPGGNTFFNQLGFYNVKSAEIIKGPGSSLYGAGTGGVVLLNSFNENFKPGFSAGYSYGSFNTHNRNFQIRFGNDNFKNSISFQKLNSDGFRDHTEMDRLTFTWDALSKLSEKGKLTAHLLYGDLYYQTPGALTLAQYISNPKAARPAAGPSPSSEEARAAIYTKTFLSGFSFEHQFNSNLSAITTLYAAFSELKNPAIRNYEKRTEPHFGGRTMLQYEKKGNADWKLQGGIEFQQGLATVHVNDNVQGGPGAQQSADEFSNRQMIVFAQAIVEAGNNWMISGGVSMNKLSVKNNRIFPLPAQTFGRDYKNELAPRLAVIKRLRQNSSVYASLSRGFSPPSNGEILPSDGQLNYELEAETGMNYEAGFRGAALNNRFSYDINVFHFSMKNTITTRRDFSGAEYFLNAGSTSQFGIESILHYRLYNSATGFLRNASLKLSYTFYNFRYIDFKKGEDDFSGNKMPGIPNHNLNAALDVRLQTGTEINLNSYFADKLILNDANSDKADGYILLNFRIGQPVQFKNNLKMTVFFAGNNLADKLYGNGHDINGFGGRYYNASPGRSFSAGINIDLQKP